MHAHVHTTGRTPLDEWSVRSRGRYVQKTEQTNVHTHSGIFFYFYSIALLYNVLTVRFHTCTWSVIHFERSDGSHPTYIIRIWMFWVRACFRTGKSVVVCGIFLQAVLRNSSSANSLKGCACCRIADPWMDVRVTCPRLCLSSLSPYVWDEVQDSRISR